MQTAISPVEADTRGPVGCEFYRFSGRPENMEFPAAVGEFQTADRFADRNFTRKPEAQRDDRRVDHRIKKRPKSMRPANQDLLSRIQQLKAKYPYWGYRRICAYLKYHEKLPVNRKRIFCNAALFLGRHYTELNTHISAGGDGRILPYKWF